MQKADIDWLNAIGAHPGIIHVAHTLNSLVEHLTGNDDTPENHDLVQANAEHDAHTEGTENA